MRPKYPGLSAQVLKVSALKGTGIAEAWEAIVRFQQSLKKTGSLARLRDGQARRWFWSEVQAILSEEITADGAAARAEASVAAGKALPHARRPGPDQGLPPRIVTFTSPSGGGRRAPRVGGGRDGALMSALTSTVSPLKRAPLFREASKGSGHGAPL